jgi:hypothetical protein
MSNALNPESAGAQRSQSAAGRGSIVVKLLQSDVIQALKTRRGELELTYHEQLKVYEPG